MVKIVGLPMNMKRVKFQYSHYKFDLSFIIIIIIIIIITTSLEFYRD